MRHVLILLRRHSGKLAAGLLLALALAALWWALPVRPRISWQVAEPCEILGFTHEGRLLATAAGLVQREAGVRLYDVATGQQMAKLSEDIVGPSVLHASFSPNDRFLVVHDILGGTLRMMDIVNGQTVGQLCSEVEPDGFATFPGVCFSPDSQRFAYTWRSAGNKLTAVCVWDTATRAERFRLHGEHAPVYSPDGKVLATFFEAKPVAQEPIPELWSPDATGVTLWDAAGGAELHRFFMPHKWYVQSVVFSADSSTIAMICRAYYPGSGMLVQLRDVGSGAMLACREGNWALLPSAPGTPLHRRMLVAREPEYSKYLALDNGDERGRIRDEGYCAPANPNEEQVQLLVDRWGPSRPPESSPDGNTLAVWHAQPSRLSNWWDRLTEWLPMLPGNKDSQPPTLTLWDIRTGSKRATLPGHHDFVFSSNGELIATRRDEHSIDIWDIPPRKPLGWFLGPAGLLVLLTLGGYCWQARRRKRNAAAMADGITSDKC